MLMLLFTIGKEHYALNSEYVVEIVPKVPLKIISHPEKALVGLLNYAGSSVPILDLSQLIIQQASSSAMHTRIVLLHYKHPTEGAILLGVIAEQVVEAKRLDKNSFVDSSINLACFPFFGGTYQDKGRSIQLLKLDEFFKFFQSWRAHPS